MKPTFLTICSLLVFTSCELDQSISIDRFPSPPVLVSADVNPMYINIGGHSGAAVIDTAFTIQASLDGPSPSSTEIVYNIFTPDGAVFTSGTIADDGIFPDTFPLDGYFAFRRSIAIPMDMSGIFTIQIYARNAYLEESSSIALPMTVFNADNTAPVLTSLFAPDTVIVPSGSDINFVKVSVTAADSQGLNDIVSVSLKSLRPDSSVAGLFPLYDDGGTVVRPTFNISSGDSIASDGRYTLVIPIFSSTQKNTYREFVFTATDRSNAISQPVITRVYIQ
jgi:hypothetical protein